MTADKDGYAALPYEVEVVEQHTTHVERDHAGWYFWCEADDCYVRGEDRYHTEAEVTAAALSHEDHPG